MNRWPIRLIIALATLFVIRDSPKADIGPPASVRVDRIVMFTSVAGRDTLYGTLDNTDFRAAMTCTMSIWNTSGKHISTGVLEIRPLVEVIDPREVSDG